MTDPYAAFSGLTFERPAPGVLKIVLDAPHSTRVSRLDEVAAARKPVLRWKPA